MNSVFTMTFENVLEIFEVVHTRFEDRDSKSYKQTHQWSVRTVQHKTIPQAKFSYDLAPVEVVISKGERRWYDLQNHSGSYNRSYNSFIRFLGRKPWNCLIREGIKL